MVKRNMASNGKEFHWGIIFARPLKIDRATKIIDETKRIED